MDGRIVSKGQIHENTVNLVGFVGNNPEVRTAQSGAAITHLSIATTCNFKDGEGNRQTETEWHRITCFNGIGKCVAEHVAKGAMIMVTGRIHYTRWIGSEGQAVTDARSSPSKSTSSPRRRRRRQTNPRSGARNSAPDVRPRPSKAWIGTC